MSTESRVETNRANSQHSTGPKTEAGKKQSSLNALRHGLTSQMVVLPNEDPKAYQSHLKSFTTEYRPHGASEVHLVQEIADTSWRQNRIVALEARLLASVEMQEEVSILDAFERQAKALANLSLHSQRLSRQFERIVTQLRQLQKIRRKQEEYQLDKLLDIMQMYEARGETWVPSAEDGFVFTQTQINGAIRTRNREHLIEEAFDYHEGT